MRTSLTILVLGLAIWAAVRYLERAGMFGAAWTPADLARVDGPATAWRLASVRDDPQWCRTLLRLDGVGFARVPDRVTAPGCGWAGAVRLTGAEWSPRGPVLTCPLAAALSVWERRVVRPAARARLGSNFTAFEHFGTYSCRLVAGGTRPSQHATADAIDIAGFRTVRAGPVSVRRDWTGTSERAAFLRDVHAGACRLFGTTLGPDYNAAHRDHFHLDTAKWHYCP